MTDPVEPFRQRIHVIYRIYCYDIKNHMADRKHRKPKKASVVFSNAIEAAVDHQKNKDNQTDPLFPHD